MVFEYNRLLSIMKERYKYLFEASQDGVYLYGAGFIGKWALGYIESCGISVLGFIDSDENKWGQSIAGRLILNPSDPRISEARAILITSRHAVPAIEKKLAHLPASIMSVDAFVATRTGMDELERLESLLAHDDRSLQTLRAVLSAMLEGTPRPLAPFSDNRPFFDRFGFFNRDREIFVDAGAYVGDSLERFIWSVNGVFRHIHAFEPGIAQFAAMKKRVARLSEEWALKPNSISLINKAVSSDNRIVKLNNTSLLTQTTVDNANEDLADIEVINQIKTISLDTYFDDKNFTFLKVDVEGSECALLTGAQKSIAKYRPRIALSVYHYPTDIFDLPLLVKKLNTDYTFTLGHHSSMLMETVLYCTDNND